MDNPVMASLYQGKSAISTMAPDAGALHHAVMAQNHDIRARRGALKEKIKKAGIRYADIARAWGRDDATIVSKTLAGTRRIQLDEAQALAALLDVTLAFVAEAFGQENEAAPTIKEQIPTPEVATQAPTPAVSNYISRDLPVLSPPMRIQDETRDFCTKVGGYIDRPPFLWGIEDAYAVYARNSMMEPRYSPGELLFVNPVKPVVAGCYVAVQLRSIAPEAADEGLVARYIGRQDGDVILRRLNQAENAAFSDRDIVAIHRIVGATEG
jgi:hypothetical protein